MSCKYYEFKNGDFYCNKQEEYVDSDTYYAYCRAYNYDECEIYKDDNYERPASGGCYLTTACVIAKQLPDNCYELETLRRYRDKWLRKREDGPRLIQMYYNVAPLIVNRINVLESKDEIYDLIYKKMVKPCVKLIEEEKNEEALLLYKQMTLWLKENYL